MNGPAIGENLTKKSRKIEPANRNPCFWPVSALASAGNLAISTACHGSGDGTGSLSSLPVGGLDVVPSLAGRTATPKGSERDLSEVKLKKGEPIDRALRRLKKKVDRENTLKEVRNKRHYEKPSERRRRKLKVARFSAMLSARYADL
jgi:small subunit ribosomal protein S21